MDGALHEEGEDSGTEHLSSTTLPDESINSYAAIHAQIERWFNYENAGDVIQCVCLLFNSL